MGAGGEDYGFRWRLENPLRRWLTTRWRVSWLSIADRNGETPTYEVYAIEFPGGEFGERNSLVVVAQRIQSASRAERLRADPS